MRKEAGAYRLMIERHGLGEKEEGHDAHASSMSPRGCSRPVKQKRIRLQRQDARARNRQRYSISARHRRRELTLMGGLDAD